MIRWEYQLGIFIVLFIIMLIAGIVFYKALIPFGISPIHFFGSIIITIVGVSLLFFPIARGKSPPFISNVLFASVNQREMHPFEWNNEIFKKPPQKTLKMIAMPLSGIDAFRIHPYSTINDPIVVFPVKYLKKRGRGFLCEANLKRRGINYFPPDMKQKLTWRYGQRFTKCKHLYLAYTGYHDCSISSNNEQIEFEYTRDNRIDNYYLDQLEDVMTYNQRKNDRMGKGTKVVEVIGRGESDDY